MTPAKILVVDDEVELERLIKQRFRKPIKAAELNFLFATDGIEALHYLQSTQVDMVLTDINMPRMNGLTFLKEIPKIDQTLRAVVMSAYSDMANIRCAMNRGAFDFLTKPIDFQDLEITIHKTLTSVQQIRHRQQQIVQTQQDLVQAAYHDSLTNLPNRSWFMQRLTKLIEQQQSYPLLYAVLFIDLDRFKLINDSFGHRAGDLLLQAVAQRLQSCLRQPDMVARLGGDEFAILLENIIDANEAVEMVQQIQTRLRQPFKLKKTEIHCEASIGIALSTQKQYASPEECLYDADIAMYCAKMQGQGRFEVFTPAMQIAETRLLFRELNSLENRT